LIWKEKPAMPQFEVIETDITALHVDAI